MLALLTNRVVAASSQLLSDDDERRSAAAAEMSGRSRRAHAHAHAIISRSSVSAAGAARLTTLLSLPVWSPGRRSAEPPLIRPRVLYSVRGSPVIPEIREQTPAIAMFFLYTSLFTVQVETKTYTQTYNKKNRKETQKYLSNE